MLYNSTRGGENGLRASEAILKGLASDGGLFMPEKLPVLTKSLSELSTLSYQDLAYEIMKEFFTDFTVRSSVTVSVRPTMRSSRIRRSHRW